MVLRHEFSGLALKLQEASDADLSANDVRRRLSDAVSEINKGNGYYTYLVDYFGDDESGDVVYACDKMFLAPYAITSTGGSAKATINTDSAVCVCPRTIYEPEMDEAAHYAAMEESLTKTEKLYASIPLYERFIAKGERDKATADDFAGKGRSFPILKPEDIGAAVHAMGRAGSDNLGPSGIKSRIIAIAKRKGWTDKLPKAWQGDAKEGAKKPGKGKTEAVLVESVSFDGITMTEADAAARTRYPIKIISPGTGSTAHYPAEVLKKAAESNKFPAGTFMFWNHASESQERENPVGDLDRLAAVLVTPGVWNENGSKGPGVYAEASVMADYAAKVSDRAPHIGVSIRAGGTVTGRMVNGKPELASIETVDSVDYVTRAGRGGMALAECAKRLLESEVTEMITEEQIKTLIADGIKEGTKTLVQEAATFRNRIVYTDAQALSLALLSDTGLNEAQQAFVVENVIGTKDAPREIAMKEGALDPVKLTESVKAAAKKYAATLGDGSRVVNLGEAAPPALKPEDLAARHAFAKRVHESDVSLMSELMGVNTEDKHAMRMAEAAAA